MSTKLRFSALEEEILYVLYDDYLLKRSLLAVERLAVSFDNSTNSLFPWRFSLVFRTNKEQPLILENNASDGFIQTFQTYKRLEMDQEEWMFLDELLEELKEEMPRYIMMIEGLIQKEAGKLFLSRSFLPDRLDVHFEKKEMNVFFDDTTPSITWSKAWKRLAEHKKSYLSYMGFCGEELEQILHLNILSLEEIDIEDELVLEGVTEYKAVIEWKGECHSLSFYKGSSPTFETHMYADSGFYMDEMFGYVKPTPTGTLLGEFFGIEKEKGYDFEKVWKSFLSEEPALYEKSLAGFQKEIKQQRQEEVKQKVGLVVKEAYLEGTTQVIVLEDGSIFKKE